jgi:hypothetical protein
MFLLNMSCIRKSDDVACMSRFNQSKKLIDAISKLIFNLFIIVMMMETQISA